MSLDWGPLRFVLLLLFLLTWSGNGNEGSVAGSCHCDKRISSSSPPKVKLVDYLRKHLKTYDRCRSYVRFQLRSQSVCGGSNDQWVLELVSCFDLRECGSAYWKSSIHQEHSLHPSTLIPEPTEGAPPYNSTPAQIQHTTLLPGSLPLDKAFTHIIETTMPTLGYSLETGPEAEGNHKRLEEKAGLTAGTSIIAPVLSLLVIIFFLTGVLLYVLCKRKREQSQQYTPGELDLLTSPPETQKVPGRYPASSSSQVAGNLTQAHIGCTMDHRL